MMKKWIAFLCVLLSLTNMAFAAEESMFRILSIYQKDAAQYQAYLDTAQQNGYQVEEWSWGDGEMQITIDAPIIRSGDFSYSVLPNGTATITGVHVTRKVIEIPSEMDGLTVTEIAGRNSPGLLDAAAMIFESPVEKIIVPDTVISIGPYFVKDCYELKEVVLPDTLQIISDYAFTNTTAKISKLPESLTYLGEWGLEWMKVNSKKLVLPAGLVSIGNWACTTGGNTYQEVTVSGSLRHFGKEVFADNSGLKKVTLEEGLETLGVSMFADCTKISKVTIPASMKKVSDFAFDGCVSLSTVSFAKGSMLQEIGQGAFSGCKKLQKITLPEGLEVIGGEAFYGCKTLSSVVIPASVTEIGDYAFEGCSSKLKLTVVEDSFAQQWAEENGVRVKVTSAPEN